MQSFACAYNKKNTHPSHGEKTTHRTHCICATGFPGLLFRIFRFPFYCTGCHAYAPERSLQTVSQSAATITFCLTLSRSVSNSFSCICCRIASLVIWGSSWDAPYASAAELSNRPKKKDTHDVRIAVRNFANTHQPYATHIDRAAIAYMRKFWLASPGCILNGMELRKHPEPFPLFALPCSSLPVPCAPIRSEHFILPRCHRAAVGFPGPAGLPNEIKRCTHERNGACLCVYVCEKVHRQKRNAVHYPATRMTEFTSWVMVRRRGGIRIEGAASQPCTSD